MGFSARAGRGYPTLVSVFSVEEGCPPRARVFIDHAASRRMKVADQQGARLVDNRDRDQPTLQ